MIVPFWNALTLEKTGGCLPATPYRGAELAEAERAAAQAVREIPGRAQLRIREARAPRAEGVRAVVADAAREEQLVPEVQLALGEVAVRADRRGVLVGALVDREVELVGAQEERLAVDLVAAELAVIQVLPDRDAPGHAAAEVAVERRRQVVVDLEVHQVRPDQPAVGEVGGALGEERAPLVHGIVRPQGVAHRHVGRGRVVDADVSERPADGRRVQELVGDPERIVVSAPLRHGLGGAVPVGAVEPVVRIQVGEVVEVRGRPEGGQLDAADVGARLDQLRVGGGVGKVAVQAEVVAEGVATTEPDGRPLVAGAAAEHARRGPAARARGSTWCGRSPPTS